MGALFILVTLSQNLNLFFPSLFDPIITGCENYKVQYSLTHSIYEVLKMVTYDILIISSFAWFLYKYKFCAFTLTAFYAVTVGNLVWSFLSIVGTESFTKDLTTTLIFDIAWFVYVYHRIKPNRK